MGVPGADDIMLNYQSTSFHDAAYLRRLLGRKPAPEFAAWLESSGVMDGNGRLLPIETTNRLLGLPGAVRGES
jgi:ethanolamine ammonia-lyase large subunit